MKVLSRKDPAKWSREVVCPKKMCKARLEIEADDIQVFIRHGSYCEDGYPSHAVQCADCGQVIWMDDLPPLVADPPMAKWRERNGR